MCLPLSTDGAYLALARPDSPRISVGPHNPLRVMQGERATISCQVDANPPVKAIRWLRDGHHLVSNQYNHTLAEVKIADAGLYACQADNGIAPVVGAHLISSSAASSSPSVVASASSVGAPSSSVLSFFGFTNNQQSQALETGKTLVEARLQLEVLYGPRVQVRASRLMPLNEGDQVTLNCSVDAWPPAYEFVWTKQEEGGSSRKLSSSSSPTLDFASLTGNDMGNYTCTAFNRLEPSASAGQAFERQGSASALLQVRHKPGLAEIILGNQGETELGNRTIIQCRAKPPGYPEPKYSFWKWSSGVGKSNKLYLNKNSAGQEAATYTIFSARPEDEGKYGCMATNIFEPSNEAMGELVVNEAPAIVLDKTWREEDARAPGYYPYSITVRATGKPEPRVAWFHRSPVDGRRIELNSAEMQQRFRIETQSKPEPLSQRDAASGARPKYIVLSTLTFKGPLEVDDRGLYTVEFSNGLSRNAVESHQLHINHTPIPALRNMPILASNQHQAQQQQPPSQSKTGAPTAVTTRTRAGFNVGETVHLTCRVSAYPQPQFVWHSQPSNGNGPEKSVESDARYRSSVVNFQDDIWESTLSFELVSEADYGDYMCVTANQDPQTQLVSESSRIIIHLGHKSAPEPPLQVDQVDATQDSVTLQWIPGFDGGFVQNQFLVQYAPDDNSGLSLMRRYGPLLEGSASSLPAAPGATGVDPSNPMQADQYPKVYDCLSMNPCTINNLQPRHAYLMRLRARNELGASDFTDDLRVSTRANLTVLPRIQEAQFDPSKNILRFRVEPNPEYLLNNLEARIEVRGPQQLVPQAASSDPSTQTNGGEQLESEWRRYPSVPIRHEQGEAYLNMQPDSELLRLSLCSRLNESLCGPEFVLSTQTGVSSSFLRDQQGLSISIVASALILILLVGALATTAASCCLSRKSKKVERVDHHHHHVNGSGATSPANKTSSGHINGGLSLTNGAKAAAATGSHGSTTSTNSTSVVAPVNQLDHQFQHQQQQQQQFQQHLMSANASDHSSDHSRQAKLDSMLPPNYSHYADRASLMLEQQQQQQQQQQNQTSYLQDKLSSPFTGQIHGEPQIGDYFASYDPTSAAVISSLEQQQQAHSMDQAMMLNSVLGANQVYDPTNGQLSSNNNEASMYSTHQQMVDEYNNYNALAYANEQQLAMESAYGTTTTAAGQVMAQPTQASYDNSANQSYCHQSYSSPYDPQQQQAETNSSQYQQDLAAAQQQMYGTLTRAGNTGTQADGYPQQVGNNNPSPPQQQQQHQQQDQYTGLMPPPPPLPQESDYGTTRGGRLIREIIV